MRRRFKTMFFDKQGNAIEDIETYAKLSEDPNYRFVGNELLANGVFVSTVWLGVNHNIYGGVPLIFETMAFNGSFGDDLYQDRYATLENAEQEHKNVVQHFKHLSRWEILKWNIERVGWKRAVKSWLGNSK